jgi:hypothetical protein
LLLSDSSAEDAHCETTQVEAGILVLVKKPTGVINDVIKVGPVPVAVTLVVAPGAAIRSSDPT